MVSKEDRESEFVQGYHNNLNELVLKTWPLLLVLVVLIYWLS